MPTRPLKVDLHTHACGDPWDWIPYTPKELIDEYARLGFDALAITNHDCQMYNGELADYADSKGVLLIPGMELGYENQHVVLINFEDPSDICGPDDILVRKRGDNLVIAAHPYFPLAPSCGPLLDARPDIFDAIEYTHLYVPGVNFNRRALRRAAELGKPLVGSSDAHDFRHIGHTCTLVHADEKTPEAIVRAIKAGRSEVVTRPVSYGYFVRYIAGMKWEGFKRWVRGMFSRDGSGHER